MQNEKLIRNGLKIIKKMIYDFNDYNFHVWLVLLITVTLISLNLIVPKIRLNTHIKDIINNSKLVKSTNFETCLCFSAPKLILLCNHNEYAPPKTIPQEARKAATGDRFISPKKTKISPTKLLVPGKPMFANEKNKKNAEKIGIT